MNMTRTDNKKATPQQYKIIYALCRNNSMTEDDRRTMIASYTNGRTDSLKEMMMDEASAMIERLRELQKDKVDKYARRLVGNIYMLSFRISFLNKAYAGDNSEEAKRMNIAKINRFCRTHSAARKDITKMTVTELEQLKLQLEKIARDEKQAK